MSSSTLLPMAPVQFVDIVGSAFMIILSILCFSHALALQRRESQNVIWTFLVWFCAGLLVFSLSRSIAHIIQHALNAMHLERTWQSLGPVSGSLNTITFVIVGSITLFFSKVYRIYGQMMDDRTAIEQAHNAIQELNINLERKIEDRTRDLRLMERQLLQADKLASLGQLSAGVAHEINNPLGLILGYTKLMLKEADAGSQLYGDLRIIEKHAVNCKKIVEDLLKFSRSTETTKSSVQMNDLVSEVLDVVEAKFKLEKVQIVRDLGDNLPPVKADSGKLKQVFMNIMMNAKQAIEAAGTIFVSTSCDGETRSILVSFKDTGSGIAPEIIHKVFDPFFTTKPTGMGTGLGLAVSYGIVKDHDGDILVESAPGSGSTFTVKLPVEEASCLG